MVMQELYVRDFLKDEDELEKHHDTGHPFSECNILFQWTNVCVILLGSTPWYIYQSQIGKSNMVPVCEAIRLIVDKVSGK